MVIYTFTELQHPVSYQVQKLQSDLQKQWAFVRAVLSWCVVESTAVYDGGQGQRLRSGKLYHASLTVVSETDTTPKTFSWKEC